MYIPQYTQCHSLSLTRIHLEVTSAKEPSPHHQVRQAYGANNPIFIHQSSLCGSCGQYYTGRHYFSSTLFPGIHLRLGWIRSQRWLIFSFESCCKMNLWPPHRQYPVSASFTTTAQCIHLHLTYSTPTCNMNTSDKQQQSHTHQRTYTPTTHKQTMLSHTSLGFSATDKICWKFEM